MVLAELFVAVLIAGVSCVNAALPATAWRRSRDGRFALLSLSSLGWAALGALWAWGQTPLSPPSWAAGTLPIELVGLFVVLTLLATTLWPRHA